MTVESTAIGNTLVATEARATKQLTVFLGCAPWIPTPYFTVDPAILEEWSFPSPGSGIRTGTG